MKKSNLWSVALISVALGNMGTLSANEGWYAGFALGTSQVDLDVPIIESIAAGSNVDLDSISYNGFDDDNAAIVFNGGYRLNDNIAINFDLSGTTADLRVTHTETAPDFSTSNIVESYTVDSLTLTPGVHFIYPIDKDFDIYAKVGLSIILSDITQKEKHNTNQGDFSYSTSINDWAFSPIIGFGGQYNFGTNWAGTVEYTYSNFDIQIITIAGEGANPLFDGTGFETQTLVFGLRYIFH